LSAAGQDQKFILLRGIVGNSSKI